LRDRVVAKANYLQRVPDAGIPINNDEIEVACDLLSFRKTKAPFPADARALWDRLQSIRHGDYGGNAATTLSRSEAAAVIAAGRFTEPLVPLDEDEAALVRRLAQAVEPRRPD
jgi:hypothetical protein